MLISSYLLVHSHRYTYSVNYFATSVHHVSLKSNGIIVFWPLTFARTGCNRVQLVPPPPEVFRR